MIVNLAMVNFIKMPAFPEKMDHANDLNAQLHGAGFSGFLSDDGERAYFPHSGILGQTAEAKGTEINATIGQALEDDGSPMVLEALAHQRHFSPSQFLYSPSFGQPEIVRLWKQEIFRKNPSLDGRVSNPVVTNGLTHGLSIVGRMFLGKDDWLIAPDMLWDNYALTFSQTEIDTFPTFKGGGFNVGGLEDKLSGDGIKKVVLLNFPNNPTGYTPTIAEAAQIAQVMLDQANAGKRIIAICDDAYFGLTFEEGIFQESIFAKLANLHGNILAVKVDGVSKEMYAWGLRVGFVTYASKNFKENAEPDIGKALRDKTAGLVRATISNVATITQYQIIEAMKDQHFYAQAAANKEKLRGRYQAVKHALESNSHYAHFFKALPFNSGYFMCVRLSDGNADTVRQGLIQNHSTGVISFGNDLLRIAYSSVPTANIPRLFRNLYDECKTQAKS